MGQLQSIIVIILLWIISLVEPSGWGMAMRIPDKVNMLISVAAIVCFIVYPQRRLQISRVLFSLLVVFLVLLPYILSSTWQGASYTVAFLTTYIVSQGKITNTVIKYSALAIAGMGIFVLNTYIYGDILSGWNDNAISMVGLFSYLYFSIFLIYKRGRRAFWLWNIVTVIYLQMLFQTDCRSGMLFSVVAVVAIYYAGTTRRIMHNNFLRILMLNIPLILSVIVISIAASSLFDQLNQWSMQNLDKDIFSDRQTLWEKGFELLKQSNYLGTGKFMLNYHNSGVAALSVFGIIGYICWVKFFSTSLNILNRYLKDNIVFGSMLAFFLIFLQQSVDLGFIGEYPNLLPYTILGIGLGRARLLYQYKNSEG